MKKNIMMKVLTILVSVATLTGCANPSAEDISAVLKTTLI